MIFDKNYRVLVTGASGMVGKSVVKLLQCYKNTQLLCPKRSDLDLTDKAKVFEYFEVYKPEIVFMLAAKVGGIQANIDDPINFLNDNLKIQLNLFEACYKFGTKKNLFLGSSCIYPKHCSQPMKEELLMTGKLESTNEGYALAKIVGLKMANLYYKKHGMITVCPMACNIYGTNDHYDLRNSHVLSALVKKFVDAKKNGLEQVEIWGSGKPRREFIHVNDVASGLIHLMNVINDSQIINLGTGNDISIKSLSKLISDVVQFQGDIIWNTNKQDGMEQKCLDVTKQKKTGFKHAIDLKDGIKQTVEEYINLTKNS